MKIAIVTDAWEPQVNGVVRTYKSVTKVLEGQGHDVFFISPNDFYTVPCPTYPEIELSVLPKRKLSQRLDHIRPDAIHVATEGPLGWAARSYCIKNNRPFSTCYHTKFPEYVYERFRVPLSWSYNTLRRFHSAAGATMVTNRDIRRELEERSFVNLKMRRMGVDHDIFCPGKDKSFLAHLPRPVMVCHGRVAPEKNLETFINMKFEGTKIVIGPGPVLEKYRHQYPDVVFTNYLPDEDMVQYIQAADVMVFPSLTETFGLVMLEAIACGIPVAAFPVTGPSAVIGESGAGVLHKTLEEATEQALKIKPDACLKRAQKFSWVDSAQDFLGSLQKVT